MSAAGSLDARLRALEQQVAALAGRAGGGEQLSPSYLSVNAQGQVSAQFSGNVQLTEAPANTFVPGNAIAWQDSAGTEHEWLQGVGTPAGAHRLAAVAEADINDITALTLVALANAAFGGNFLFTQISDNAGGHASITILDSAQRSGFLQLLSAQKLQLAYGTGQTGNIGAGATVAQPHGIGRAPVVSFVQGVGWVAPIALGAADSTNIYWWTNIALNGNYYAWIAIG